MVNEKGNQPSAASTNEAKVDWTKQEQLITRLKKNPAETLNSLLSEPDAVSLLAGILTGYGNEKVRLADLRHIMNSISGGEKDPKFCLIRAALEEEAINFTKFSVFTAVLSIIGILTLSLSLPHDIRWLMAGGALVAGLSLMWGLITQIEAHCLWWRHKKLFGQTPRSWWSRLLLPISVAQPVLVAVAIAAGIQYNTYCQGVLTNYKTDGISFRYPKFWLPPRDEVTSTDYTTPRILRWASSGVSETIHVLERERQRLATINTELLLWVCSHQKGGAACDLQFIRVPKGGDSLESRFEEKRRLSETIDKTGLDFMDDHFVKFSVDQYDLPSGYPALIQTGQKANGETMVSYEFLSGQFVYVMIFVYDSAQTASKGTYTRDRIIQTLSVNPSVSSTTADVNKR